MGATCPKYEMGGGGVVLGGGGQGGGGRSAHVGDCAPARSEDRNFDGNWDASYVLENETSKAVLLFINVFFALLFFSVLFDLSLIFLCVICFREICFGFEVGFFRIIFYEY